MLPPLPRCRGRAYSSLKITHPYQPSPIPLSGRPAHRPFRDLLGVHSRCGLHTRAVTKFVTAIRRLQTFRHLHACPGCFRLERSPGGPYTHWKAPPWHGAPPSRVDRAEIAVIKQVADQAASGWLNGYNVRLDRHLQPPRQVRSIADNLAVLERAIPTEITDNGHARRDADSTPHRQVVTWSQSPDLRAQFEPRADRALGVVFVCSGVAKKDERGIP